MQAITRNAISYYKDFIAPRDAKSDYEQGVADGHVDLPRSEQASLGTYELGVVQEGLADLSKLRLSHGGERQAIGNSVAGHLHSRLDEYETEAREVSHRHDEAKHALDRSLGPASTKAQEQEIVLFEAEEAFKDLRRDEDREPLVRMVTPRIPLLPLSLIPRFRHAYVTPYAIGLLIISVVDIFINRTVIEDLLGGDPTTFAVFMVTGILGLTLVLFGHMVGLFIRQARVRRRPVEWLRVFVGIPIILLVVGATLYELAVIRQVYLGLGDGIRSAQASFSGLSFQDQSPLQQAIGTGLAGLVPGLLEHLGNVYRVFDPIQPLNGKALLLLLINSMVFIAGVTMSYRRHDPHPDFEELADAVFRAKRAIAERESAFAAEVERLGTRYLRQRDSITKRATKLERRIAVFTRNAKSNGISLDEERERIVAVVTKRVLTYQTGNSRTRRTKPPPYFGPPSITMVRRMMGVDDIDISEKPATADWGTK